MPRPSKNDLLSDEAKARGNTSYDPVRYKKVELNASAPFWHKQPKESVQAYSAFMTYLTIPADERTYPKVCEIVGKSIQLVRGWGQRWAWRERAGAYEEHYLLLKLESVHAERDRMWREQQLLSETALQVVTASLAHFASQIDEEGHLTTIKGDQLVRLMAEAAKIQRMAVMGRVEGAEHAHAENESLLDSHADELATVLDKFTQEIQLTPDQQKRLPEALKSVLLGAAAE